MTLRGALLVWVLMVAGGMPLFGACMPKLSFSQKLPNSNDKAVAIFVGCVKRITRPVEVMGSPVRQYPVVSFAVLEKFVGVPSTEFVLSATSDVFFGSIPHGTPLFREGEVWLAEAYYNDHEQRWMTSTCQRTTLAQEAGRELDVLRAWIVGKRF